MLCITELKGFKLFWYRNAKFKGDNLLVSVDFLCVRSKRHDVLEAGRPPVFLMGCAEML